MNRQLLENSTVGKDFLSHDEHPDLDVLLDYRLRLTEMRKEKEYPDVFYTNEIAATDEVIRILNDSTTEGN